MEILLFLVKDLMVVMAVPSKLVFIALCLLFLSGCRSASLEIEPVITYTPPPKWVESLPTAFSPLTATESRQEWSKEFRLGMGFIGEQDYYRALTCFKRALFMVPPSNIARKQQIEFSILETYYLGNKYKEVVEAYEKSSLYEISFDFAAYKELLLILIDSYQHLEQCDKVYYYEEKINAIDVNLGTNIQLSQAVQYGEIDMLEQIPHDVSFDSFVCSYREEAKSIKTAETLNAVFPGAGYLYVGQPQAALTSFIINTLFITAAVQFFQHGYTALGLITTSLEFGWYFGGINGAGLAAKEYNERLYEVRAKDFMIKERLFPVLMFQYAF